MTLQHSFFLLHFLRAGCTGPALPLKTSDDPSTCWHGHWKLDMLVIHSQNIDLFFHTDSTRDCAIVELRVAESDSDT